MILSNEPGYYRPGAFGIRIENLVVTREPAEIEGGDQPMLSFDTLTFCPIDRRLVLPALLTDDELDWLNAYHADQGAKSAAATATISRERVRWRGVAVSTTS